MSKPAQFADWPDDLEIGYGPYRASAERVVDADSVYAFLSPGLNKYAYESLRLKDVDAPEIFSGPVHVRAWGRAAMEELKRILPLGTKMLAVTTKDKQTFGRYEAELVLADGTTANDRINAWMREQEWYAEYLAYKGTSIPRREPEKGIGLPWPQPEREGPHFDPEVDA